MQTLPNEDDVTVDRDGERWTSWRWFRTPGVGYRIVCDAKGIVQVDNVEGSADAGRANAGMEVEDANRLAGEQWD